MEQYLIYLRKSRSDMELENSGAENVLNRHEKTLLELAQRMNLPIGDIYREIVSGENIRERPFMRRLLTEVSAGKWSGVLVMEIPRLARGDTMDQGTILQTFQYSNTKIITPTKIYDPQNPEDTEFFEFGLFMSRREYVMINRRLQAGRMSSFLEGKYIASIAPYGYEKIKLKGQKGWTLQIVPEEAKIVRLIFDWYVNGMPTPEGEPQRCGLYTIANRLIHMGVPAKKNLFSVWDRSTIHGILMNWTYAGYVVWGVNRQKKIFQNGAIQKKVCSDRENAQRIPGLHEPIVPEAMLRAAEERLSKNIPLKKSDSLQNPLAGILFCGKCGGSMVRKVGHRKTGELYETLSCGNKYRSHCDTVASYLPVVEEALLSALQRWAQSYTLVSSSTKPQKANSMEDAREILTMMEKELENIDRQIARTHELLELDVYDIDTFVARSKSLAEKKAAAAEEYERQKQLVDHMEQTEKAQKEFIPNIYKILDLYDTMENAQAKNELLRRVVEKVEYFKDAKDKKNSEETSMKIKIYPRLPKARR